MKIKVSGIEGLEGEYDIAEPPFTTKEWREIKIHTGLMPLDLEEHFGKGDPDVTAALMWVALTRAGKDPRFVWAALDEADMFSDETFGEVAEAGDEEEDEIPPEVTPTSPDDGNETETEEEPEPSGETSPKPLALLASDPSPTGLPRSATGAA